MERMERMLHFNLHCPVVGPRESGEAAQVDHNIFQLLVLHHLVCDIIVSEVEQVHDVVVSIHRYMPLDETHVQRIVRAGNRKDDPLFTQIVQVLGEVLILSVCP